MGKEVSKLRARLAARSKGYCEMCGEGLGDNWAMHHRKLKSRGGKDELANVIAVHHQCHNLGTNSIHLNPAWATENGFMVSSWLDPEMSPILYMMSDKVLLMEDGSIQKYEEKAWQENQQ